MTQNQQNVTMNLKKVSGRQPIMRIAFVAFFIFSIVLSIASYFVLPDEVAIHFGFGGKPDSWASKEVNLIATVAIQLVVFLIFYIPSYLVDVIPAKYTNLPNKDYWLSPEKMPATKNKIQSLMLQLGFATYIMINMAAILAVHANLSDPVRFKESILLVGLALYLIFIVLWIIRFALSFRLPKSTNNSIS